MIKAFKNYKFWGKLLLIEYIGYNLMEFNIEGSHPHATKGSYDESGQDYKHNGFKEDNNSMDSRDRTQCSDDRGNLLLGFIGLLSLLVRIHNLRDLLRLVPN